MVDILYFAIVDALFQLVTVFDCAADTGLKKLRAFICVRPRMLTTDACNTRQALNAKTKRKLGAGKYCKA